MSHSEKYLRIRAPYGNHNKNFNRPPHPECEDGELFLGNVKEEVDCQPSYATERIGRQAYNIYGDPIISFKPVFALASDVFQDELKILPDMSAVSECQVFDDPYKRFLPKVAKCWELKYKGC